MDYSKRNCKGLCLQIDNIGMCVGFCSTSIEFVNKRYHHFKKEALKRDGEWEPIEYFEEIGPETEEPVELIKGDRDTSITIKVLS